MWSITVSHCLREGVLDLITLTVIELELNLTNRLLYFDFFLIIKKINRY